MKNILFILALSLHISTTVFARVGGHDGGGGQGLVCYNDKGEIESVELLDFYEGEILEGLSIPEYQGSHLDILRDVIKKFPSLSWDYFQHELEQTYKSFRFLPSGVRLRKIDDGNIFYQVPSNCQIEQIANFQGKNRIFIVSDFWEKLSSTHRAGLILHEKLWHEERDQGVKHSARVKRNVSRIFSDNLLLNKQELPRDYSKVVSCNSEEGQVHTSFSFAQDGSLYFSYLNGERVFLEYRFQYQPHPSPEFQDWRVLFKLLTRPTMPITFPEIPQSGTTMGSRFGLDVLDSENNNIATLMIDWNTAGDTPLKMSVYSNEFEGIPTEKKYIGLSCYYYGTEE